MNDSHTMMRCSGKNTVTTERICWHFLFKLLKFVSSNIIVSQYNVFPYRRYILFVDYKWTKIKKNLSIFELIRSCVYIYVLFVKEIHSSLHFSRIKFNHVVSKNACISISNEKNIASIFFVCQLIILHMDECNGFSILLIFTD